VKKMKKINKQLRSNLITYGIVVAAYIIVNPLYAGGNDFQSFYRGFWFPCAYT